MAVPRVAPIGPCGPFVKSNCFIFLLKMLWLDFNQTWQESSLGARDSKLFIWYMWLLWGAQGEGHKAKLFF